MSSELYNHFIAQGCLPHQASFAAKFTETGSSRAHLLLGPPGSGSTLAAASVIKALIERNETKLILLLVRSQPLVAQWKSVLEEIDTGLPVEVLSQRRVRELDFERQSSEGQLLERGIAIVNARPTPYSNLPLVFEAVPWDLLIVDEADSVSSRVGIELNEGLLTKRPDLRSLLIGHIPGRLARRANPLIDRFGDSLSVTEWNPSDLVDAEGNSLIPELNFTWLPFKRSEQEVRFLADLQEALSSFVGDRLRPNRESPPDQRSQRLRFERHMMLHAASSSLFALEGRLQRSRHRRNEAVHGKFRPSNADFEAEGVELREDADSNPDQSEIVDTIEFNELLDPFRKQIELLAADSKFDALANILRTDADDRVCIITSLHETAQFLASALREQRGDVATITGMLSGEDREFAVDHFSKNGGTLIVTPASITPLIAAKTVIFYDVPSRPDALDDQVGMFMRRGGFKSIRMFALFDESGVLEMERGKVRRPFES